MLIAAAVLLHAALLGAVDGPAATRRAAESPLQPIETRTIGPAAPLPMVVPIAATDAELARPAPRVAPRAPRAAPRRAAAAVLEAPAAEAPLLLAQADVAPSPSAAASTAAAAAPSADTAPIPHYRTQMPGAATLRYQLARGMLHGTGELHWKPDGDRYEARLEGKLGSMTLLTQISSGGFDADGIAPVRFTDWRVRRSTVAANFQRPAGKVTFSGAEQELPLQPGMQDRVSWMVQLAAIVAAQPALRNPGAKIVMHIVGAHGDTSVWTFHCAGRETVQTGLGPIATIKYARESEGGAYDTRAAAWLDAAHHYLPARATMRSGPNDEGFELLLEGVDGTP